MLYKKVQEFFQEDNQIDFKDFQKFSKKNKKTLAKEINYLQLQLSKKKPSWSNFEWNKLNEHVERSLMDLELTKNDSIQINKMIQKFKTKKNKKIAKEEKERLLKDFNDSLTLNRQQWRAITKFLYNLITNLELKYQETSLNFAKSKKLNLNLLEEINKLEHKLIMQKKTRIPIDLSSNSIFQKENSLNFNDISSCYSESRQTFSEMSKPFSNHNHSWLLQNNDKQNNKFSSSHTDSFQQELLLNEKENHQNDSQQKIKSIGDISGFGFLIPDDEKLGKIMNTKISQKQLLNLSNKDEKIHNNFLIKNENISSFSLNKQHSNKQKF